MYKKQTLYQQEGKRLISVYPADLPRLGALLRVQGDEPSGIARLATALEIAADDLRELHERSLPCQRAVLLQVAGRHQGKGG
jgi:hypothetical protein